MRSRHYKVSFCALRGEFEMSQLGEVAYKLYPKQIGEYFFYDKLGFVECSDIFIYYAPMHDRKVW